MNTNFAFEDKKGTGKSVPEAADDLDVADIEELEAVTQALVRITKRSAGQIKPYLSDMLERLRELKQPPFYETATPEEWSQAFLAWAESHDQDTPLSDYAVSRESMYDDKR